MYSIQYAPATAPKHILAGGDLSAAEMKAVFSKAADLKKRRALGSQKITQIDGLLLSMIFEKQSLRTRVSFETAFHELGGHSVYLTKADIDPGKRETLSDIAQTLSCWSTLIVARMKSQTALEELAAASKVAVINALTDTEHPCQALADLMTLQEIFGEEKLKLAWIGDGNNVVNSFAVAAAKLGHTVFACTPKGYEPPQHVLDCEGVHLTHQPLEAAESAHAVYTDVWVSMGQEDEAEKRMKDFAGFQVNAELMAAALPNAIFMHCLPAHRGEEVTAEVIDGPKSVVFSQADNRLHAQKALMKLLMEGALQ